MSVPAELLIDVGHSRLKWARRIGRDLEPSSIQACPLDHPRPLLDTLIDQGIQRVIWSPQSRSDRLEALEHELCSIGVSCTAVTTGSLDLPVAPAYPALGSDRWLAMQWPWLQSQRALCVVDCGTAATLDAVDAQGQHRGGWILAGLPSLLRGLAVTAPDLPETELMAEQTHAPATDSAEAIGGGVQLQLIGGLQLALKRLRATIGSDFDLWLTGGNAESLATEFDRPHRLDSHLVLRGLALTGAAR